MISKIFTSAFAFLCFGYVFSQKLEYGLEFRVNQNNIQFSKYHYPTLEGVTKPGFYQNDPEKMEFPAHHQEIYLDTGSIYLYWNQASAGTNIEIPLSVRFTTKRGWMLNLRASVSKYKINYTGSMHRDGGYYTELFGDYNDYVNNYSGSFSTENVNLDPDNQYDDTQAFINYFNGSVDEDIHSRLTIRRVEELKFYSLYFSAGKKFFQHKIIHPYFNVGLGYRVWVGNQKRQYTDLGDTELEKPIINDLLGISQQVDLFNTNAISGRFDFGAEFYRYYFGVGYQVTSTFDKPRTAEQDAIMGYNGSTLSGMNTFTVFLGVNLFSKDFRTKSNQLEVYQDEYNTLSSKVDRNRKWGIAAKVKTAFVSGANNYGTFFVGDYTDYLNPETNTLNLKMQLLEFNYVNNINWSPKLELALRYTPANRFETELEVGVSRLQMDTGVDEFSAVILTDTSTWEKVYDEDTKRRNAATFRIEFVNLSSKLNFYYAVLSKDLIDLKIMAGMGYNYMISTGDVQRELGVNGKGDDVYSRLEDYYWDRLDDNYNGFTFYSEYDQTSDPGGDAQDMITKLEQGGWGALKDWNNERTYGYITFNVGAELEVKRFLLGMTYERTLGAVDGIFIKEYQNFNLSLGYMLFTKNGLNGRVRTTF